MHSVEDQSTSRKNKFAGFDETSVGNGSWTVPTYDIDGTSNLAEVFQGSTSFNFGENDPRHAGKDAKPSWGFGGKAPDVRGIAACFSSLDTIENNRHSGGTVPDYYRRPTGRGKFCGRCCIRGVDPKTGRKIYRRLNCGSWNCSYCGPKRARRTRRAIRAVAEALNLRYFLTLTLDPKNVEHPKSAVPHLRMCFNKFREYLKRKYGDAPSYICILEFTQAGMPHLHILLDRRIEQRWISQVWDRLGGGRIVFIKQVAVHRVARYLSKYLTKELLLSAPKGTRRITTARSIKLFPAFDSGIAWEVLKSSIWQMLSEERMRRWGLQANLYEFISIELDEDRYMKAFQLHNAWSDGEMKGPYELVAARMAAI